MGVRRDIEYTEPTYGRSGAHEEAICSLSGQDQGDGTVKPVVVAASRTLVANEYVTEAVDAILNGRRTSFRTGQVGAFLTAKEPATETAIAVDDDTGFADGDPVAIFNTSSAGVPTSPEYRLISGSPSGNVITLNSGLTAAKYKGARIVRLRGFDVSCGTNGRGGVKSQLTAPSAPSISVADGGSKITVTVTANDEDEATHYDTYVRTSRFRVIEPGWIPDDENRTSVASFDVTTHGGGVDAVPDGAGGSIGSDTYYVAVVAKNGTGRRDVDESVISNVEEITVA